MIIKLVRHGESMSNVNKVKAHIYGDSKIELTDNGVSQAVAVGKKIGSEFLQSAILFCSPYIRTRQTAKSLEYGATNSIDKLNWIEDPLIREIDLGYQDYDSQEEKRKKHGWFYYRFNGGESPADVYNRVSIFLNHLMRKDKKNVLIVTHGLLIKVFIMRFLKLSVEDFDSMKTPSNCSVFTICTLKNVPKTMADDEVVLYKNEQWCVYGKLDFYPKDDTMDKVNARFMDKLMKN